jgi:hypothetical protein
MNNTYKFKINSIDDQESQKYEYRSLRNLTLMERKQPLAFQSDKKK